MVRLSDRPDMTLAVHRGRKTTIQSNKKTHIVLCLIDKVQSEGGMKA